jgi:hypothetical protein
VRDSKKLANLDDEYTVVAIDQTRQELANLVYAWFAEGERPTLPVSGAWESLKLLGGITDDGETFYLPCEDNFTSDLTVRLLDALQTEFGEKLCVVLDNAPYFAANKVKNSPRTRLSNCVTSRGVHRS